MAKVEIEIPQVTEERLVEAMAHALLAEGDAYDEDGNPVVDRWSRKKIGEHLRRYLDEKLTELHETLVREHFDAVVKARIEAAVDEVLAEGWYQTDNYGSRTSTKHSLKERISDHLAHTDSYNRPNLLATKIKTAVDEAMAKEFGPIIAEAGKKVREQLDNAITAKFAEVVRNALGVR